MEKVYFHGPFTWIQLKLPLWQFSQQQSHRWSGVSVLAEQEEATECFDSIKDDDDVIPPACFNYRKLRKSFKLSPLGKSSAPNLPKSLGSGTAILLALFSTFL